MERADGANGHLRYIPLPILLVGKSQHSTIYLVNRALEENEFNGNRNKSSIVTFTSKH